MSHKGGQSHHHLNQFDTNNNTSYVMSPLVGSQHLSVARPLEPSRTPVKLLLRGNLSTDDNAHSVQSTSGSSTLSNEPMNGYTDANPSPTVYSSSDSGSPPRRSGRGRRSSPSLGNRSLMIGNGCRQVNLRKSHNANRSRVRKYDWFNQWFGLGPF